MKRVFREIRCWGSNDTSEIAFEYVEEDTKEKRQEILQDYGIDVDEYFKVECDDFIDGKVDDVYFEHCGDWDEPTAYAIQVLNIEDAVAEIKSKYLKRLKKLGVEVDERI